MNPISVKEFTTRADVGGRTPYVVPLSINVMSQSEQFRNVALI